MGDSNIKPSAKTASIIITCALLFCVSLLLAACGTSSGTSLSDDNTHKESIEANKNQSHLVPGLYSVFDDKSGSVKTARISPIQEQDLLSLINVLRQTGGELSFGLIGESRMRPLLRLRIPVPPAPPVKRDFQNAFERAEEDSAFQGAMESYEAKRKQWEADVNQRIDVFMQAVRPPLQQPAREKATDIVGALERAELFLNEPDAVWPAETARHRYVILNSDGVATTNRKPVEIRSGACLLLINGSGSLGTIEPLHPLQFESKQAALDYITATELGRNR